MTDLLTGDELKRALHEEFANAKLADLPDHIIQSMLYDSWGAAIDANLSRNQLPFFLKWTMNGTVERLEAAYAMVSAESRRREAKDSAAVR
jgi:hypothetical protein